MNVFVMQRTEPMLTEHPGDRMTPILGEPTRYEGHTADGDRVRWYSYQNIPVGEWHRIDDLDLMD